MLGGAALTAGVGDEQCRAVPGMAFGGADLDPRGQPVVAHEKEGGTERVGSE